MAPMTDREQIRRDAKRVLRAVKEREPLLRNLANGTLALLAELEQAEQKLAAERLEHGDTLLALAARNDEKEQAERKRDDWEKIAEQRAMYAHEQAARLHETAHGWEGADQSAALNYWRSRATDADAQLAKVPALVEALEEACDWLDADLAENPDTGPACADRELIARWRAALAGFEQEQKP